jgi:hypothetical protein
MLIENPDLFGMWDKGIRENVYDIKGRHMKKITFTSWSLFKEKQDTLFGYHRSVRISHLLKQLMNSIT